MFVGKQNKRLYKEGIEAILRRVGVKSGVENVYPHRFRRTLATNMINKGASVQEVQQILGHSKIDTTMLYCNVDKDCVKMAHKKYSA